jgi:drug/metabolite transporter (DMT)-like permease
MTPRFFRSIVANLFRGDLSIDTEAQQNAKRGEHTALATAALALSGCLWGTGFLFGKIAFGEMTVSENVLWRFVTGSLALMPFFFMRGPKRLDWKAWRLVLIGGFIGVPIQFLVQFKGLQLTTVSHAALMVGTLPMMLALSSVIFLHERLRLIEWLVLGLSGVGAVLIATSAKTSSGPAASAKGDAMVVVSLMAAVVMILLTKKLVQDYGALQITIAMIGSGTLMVVIWFVATQPVRFDFSARTWMAAAAQGVLATAMAYLLWNWGLAKVPASRAGVFLNMEPLVGAVLGVIVLRESLGALAIVGGAMIIGAALYFSRRSGA